MDERLIEKILNEDVPEWKEEDLKATDDNFENVNEDALSLCAEEVENNKLNSVNSTVTDSVQHEMMSLSSGGTTTPGILSPQINKKIKSPDRSNGNKRCKDGKILRYATLTKVANQLRQAGKFAQEDGGLPTCCTRSKYLAIGTSKGLVFMFDMKQVLRVCVGQEERIRRQYGAVSGLSFNADCTRLLMGYVRSHIDMWDVSNEESGPRLLRSIDVNEGSGLGYAVSCLKFLPDPARAVYVDTQGSVFQLTFKRGITGRSADMDCFFSGSRGEILCLEPLVVSRRSMCPPEIVQHSLIAMASFTKIIVVSAQPQLKVNFMHPLKGAADTLPQLEWSPMMKGSRDVLLLFARDHAVFIFRITVSNSLGTGSGGSISNQMQSEFATLFSHSMNGNVIDSVNGDLQFHSVTNFPLAFRILAIKWMNRYCLGVLDTTETFHVVDTKTQTILESIDVSSAELVYNTSLFKSTATGGHVSEAMRIAAERACYHTVTSEGNQIKLLGTKTVHVLMLRPYKELLKMSRISVTLDTILELFRLCGEFWRGPAKSIEARCVLNLPDDADGVQARMMRESEVGLCARNILEWSMTVPDGNEEVNWDWDRHFREAMSLCRVTGQMNYFTDKLYRAIPKSVSVTTAKSTNVAMAALLRCLATLILDREIPPRLHPELVQLLVEYLLSVHHLSELDKCLSVLEIDCLDLHYVSSVAQQHNLFACLIHIHNNAFQDLVTPLRAISDFLVSPQFDSFHPDTQIEVVNMGIAYVHNCLASHFDSDGDNQQQQQQQQQQILEIFLGTAAVGKNQTETGAEASPNLLRLLVWYNSYDLFNMLSLAFEERFFQHDELGASRKQAVLQQLCDIFCDNSNSSSFGSWAESKRTNNVTVIVYFLTFLSRELSPTRTPGPVFIAPETVEQLIENACLALIGYSSSSSSSAGINSSVTGDGMDCPVLDSDNIQKQQQRKYYNLSTWRRKAETTILVFLHMEGGDGKDKCDKKWISRDRILKLAHSARLFRVCELIYRERGMLDMVLESYLLDDEYQSQSYAYFNKIWMDESVNKEQKQCIIRKCFQLATNLVRAGPVLSVVILLSVCRFTVEDIVSQLKSSAQNSSVADCLLAEETEFLFLRALFVIRGDLDPDCVDDDDDDEEKEEDNDDDDAKDNNDKRGKDDVSNTISSPGQEFTVLQGLDASVLSDLRRNSNVTSDMTERFLQLLTLFACSSCNRGRRRKIGIGRSTSTSNRYARLLEQMIKRCSHMYRTEQVASLLVGHISHSQSSLVDLCHSLALLYDKMQQYQQAANLYIRQLDHLWYTQHEGGASSASSTSAIVRCINNFVTLMGKCTPSTTSASTSVSVPSNKLATQPLWTTMLDWILEKYSTFIDDHKEPSTTATSGGGGGGSSGTDVNIDAKDILSLFVKNMSTVIPISVILNATLQNRHCKEKHFGRLKHLFLAVQESSLHEASLLQAGIAVVASGSNKLLQDWRKELGRGMLVHMNGTSQQQAIQNRSITGGGAAYYYCGHTGSLNTTWCPVCYGGGLQQFNRNAEATVSLPQPPPPPPPPVPPHKTSSPSLTRKQQLQRATTVTVANTVASGTGKSELRLAPPNYLINFMKF